MSLASGRQVFYSLDSARFRPVAVFMDHAGRLWIVPEKLVIQNTCTDIEQRLEADAEPIGLESLGGRVDVVFIALHGKYGDDGCVQGALELVDLPYTGSGVLACAVSLDKPMAHALLGAGGFDVAKEIVVGDDEWAADPGGCATHIGQELGFPCVVLPAREGSSLGVSVVDEPAGLAGALDAAFRYDRRVVVEEMLAGMEFSVIVLGNTEPRALPPTEIATSNAYMTYDDKYMPGRSQKITPARVGSETLAMMRSTAERIYGCLGFRGYARLDGFLTADNRLVFTDPNSTCGMAPSSFLFHQAAEEGVGATELVSGILDSALAAHAAKSGPL